MSDVQRDRQFYDMADAYISVANQQLSETKPSRVSAAALFAASRFNAFVIAAASGSKEQMLADKEAAIAYFMDQYEKMLRENIDEHLARFFDQPPG